GELRGLDLEERRAGELGQAARDLGLPDPGRPDHDDVLGRDLVLEIALDALAPPAVAQGDRDRALGGALADDVAIELQDDPGGREVGGADRRGGGHGSSSIVIEWLVYTQMSAAMPSAASAMARASSVEWARSARAAARAKGPPEPIAAVPSSGS